MVQSPDVTLFIMVLNDYSVIHHTVHPESVQGASLFPHFMLCYLFQKILNSLFFIIPKCIQFIIFLKILQTIPHNDNVNYGKY